MRPGASILGQNRDLRDELLNQMNAQVRYWYGQRATELSEKELEKLRGLGYVQ